MTDPTLGGWARLVGKLPTFRGIVNYFYVAANWTRISEEQEAYRRQIKDREEWASRSLAQQAELHDLALQRTTAELAEWRYLAEQASEQQGTTAARLEQAINALLRAQEAIEARNNAWADCTILLAVLLQTESPASRQLLYQHMDELTSAGVERVIARIAEISQRPTRPGLSALAGLDPP
ncbi:MAG TPA: hypothetical protein VNP53_05035 [Methylomirabilota bacterium]|nr:hypothetical protein [Methylomirabilota bacterium]